MDSISVVIPVLDEVENIAGVHREVVEVCEKSGYRYEIIIVDDGSTDGTDHEVARLRPVTVIRFRKRFGQTAAMDAGIKQAKFDLVVTMDGDGQNDPADIPNLIQRLHSDRLDVVSGWRKTRRDPFGKRLASRLANLLRSIMIRDGIHDSGCSLKVYRRECFQGLTLFGEMHRFIPALLKIKGFKVGEVVVGHRPRRAGRTKYGLRRGFKGFIDILSVWFWNKYAVRPLHLLGGLGLFSILAGMIVSVVGITFYILRIRTFRNILPIVAVFLFLSGIQLFVFGLMSDILSRSYFLTTSDAPYSIERVRSNPGRTD
jgi:glycosyltransferase involved in cell wall biosynthesis